MRSFRGKDVAWLALSEGYFGLDLIESVVFRVECLLKVCNLSVRVNAGPRQSAGSRFAVFHYQQQCIEAVSDLLEWSANDRLAVNFCEIVHLARIVL